MKIAETRLIPYGFIKQEHSYVYVYPILDRQFSVCIQIIHQQIKSQIVDNETQEPYIVWKTHPEGRFVQSVRSAYDQVMHDFFQHCCIVETYRFAQTNRIDAQMPTQATFPFRKYLLMVLIKDMENGMPSSNVSIKKNWVLAKDPLKLSM